MDEPADVVAVRLLAIYESAEPDEKASARRHVLSEISRLVASERMLRRRLDDERTEHAVNLNQFIANYESVLRKP